MAEMDPGGAATREQFLTQVHDWSAALNDYTTENSDTVNKRVIALRKWIAKLDQETPDLLRQVLSGLMADNDPATRYLAAVFMVDRGAEEQALAVIQEIADNYDYGAVCSTAKTSLWLWREEKAENQVANRHKGTE